MYDCVHVPSKKSYQDLTKLFMQDVSIAQWQDQAYWIIKNLKMSYQALQDLARLFQLLA